MARYIVGRVADLPPGSRRMVDAGGRSIGVFNIGGRYYALRNRCPHQGAPLCLGKIKGTTLPGRPYEYAYGREDEIIQCPWHGWEFEIATGRTFFKPHRLRAKAYEVTIDSADGAENRPAANEDEAALETFPVTHEDGLVILHA